MHTLSGEEAAGQAALYALGALEEGEARAFEEHLTAGCEACEAELRGYGEVVEGLALNAPAAPSPPAGVRSRLLALAAEEPRGDGAGAESCSAGAAERPAAKGFYVLRAEEGKWAETDDEGVTYKLLFADRERGTLTTLVRMRPGSRIRPHRHLGVEQCLVLEGDVRSGPYSMKAGDFNCSMPGSVHEELVSDGGALLLLVAPASYESLAR